MEYGKNCEEEKRETIQKENGNVKGRNLKETWKED